MSGTIGLTPAGQALDRYVATMGNRRAAASLCKFIEGATKELRQAQGYGSQVVLMALRKYYKDKALLMFGWLDEMPQVLLLKYIHALSSPGFVPTTRTQEALVRRCRRGAGLKDV